MNMHGRVPLSFLQMFAFLAEPLRDMAGCGIYQQVKSLTPAMAPKSLVSCFVALDRNDCIWNVLSRCLVS